MQVQLSSCLWSVVIGMVLLVFIILVLLKTEVLSFRSAYQSLLKTSCDTAKYMTYNSDLPTITPGVYQHDLAQFLMNTSENVSLSNCEDLGPPPTPPGFDWQDIIIGSDPLRPSLERMYAYVFHSSSQRTMIIAFTGTIFLDEWIDDLYYPEVTPYQLTNYIPRKNILVHGGFYGIYASIQRLLWKALESKRSSTDTLLITGHSLGGGLATICSVDFGGGSAGSGINVYTYTFAAPRSGNNEFAAIYEATNPDAMRVFNTEDIIPSLPPPVWDGYIYTHGGKNIPFTVNLGDIAKNHTVAYEDYLP